MNSEIIKTLAADAIGKWAREHHGNCVLSIENGIVVAKRPKAHERMCSHPLFITCFAQKSGLTFAAWNMVGTELLNLYNKEKACQNQKVAKNELHCKK